MLRRRMNNGGRRGAGAFTLIELMIVVLIIGVLLAIAGPNFNAAREKTYRRSCIENLNKMEIAKNCYMMDHNLGGSTPATTFTDAALYGTDGYLRAKPSCPGGGTYTINDGSTSPTCDYSNGGNIHVLTDL